MGNAPAEYATVVAPAREDAEQPSAQRGGVPAAVVAIGFPLLAAVAIGCWWFLYRWYGVFQHRSNTHFAFEKLPGGFDNPTLRNTLLIFLALTAVYVGVLLLLAMTERLTPLRGVSLGVLVAGMATGAVLLYPVGALDVFNYMIELKLAYHYDQNPYLVTFEAYRSDPYALPAFLVNVPLFYGPAWLLVSWLPLAVTGLTDVIETLLGLKVFNVALLLLTAVVILWSQKGSSRRWLAAAIFLVNPLVMFEGVANAHNDVMLTVFLAGAMLALQRRSPLAGPLLALSALVKLYTLALAPLFLAVALRGRWGWKRIASTLALTLATVVLVCAPYWEDGKLVDGLRSGLEQSQAMDHVSLFSLAQQYEQQQLAEGHPEGEFIRSRPAQEVLPQETKDTLRNGFSAAMVVIALALAVSAWKGRDPALVAAETLLVLSVTSTNLYSWYLVPVFALIALRPDRLAVRYVVAATALGLAYYPMLVYAHFNTEMSRFEVHQFLALFLTLPILVYLALRWSDEIAAALRRRRAMARAG